MKGQLSLEALVVFGIGLTVLAFLFPAISTINNAGKQLQSAAAAGFALDRLASACDEARITGEQKEMEIFFLGNATLSGLSGTGELLLEYGNVSSKINTSCSIAGAILFQKGKNPVTIEPDGKIS